MAEKKLQHMMTVDVEEHFQVSAFESVVDRSDWENHPSRVEANTHRLLDLFDDCNLKATFFVLGWVAERQPKLVAEIASRGHELASHGYSHRLVYNQTPDEFEEETKKSKAILESLGGRAIEGYRAASFSIGKQNLWALDVLIEAGFKWDSSLFPVHHDRYGMPGAPRVPYIAKTPQGNSILEIPPSTSRLFGMTVPFGGGGYLRLFPLTLTKWLFKRMEEKERRGGIVYLHPWEVDPAQPRIKASLKSRFRHYVGLNSTIKKLRALNQKFAFTTVSGAMQQHAEPLDTVLLNAEL